MTVQDTRRLALRAIIDRQFGGVQARFGTAIGRQDDYVSRLLSGKKQLGERLAREIERTLGLTRGALDHMPDSVDHAEIVALPPRSAGGIPILSWEQLVRFDQEEERTTMLAMATEVAPPITGRGSPDFAAFVRGPAMEPEFTDGSLVYVDAKTPAKHGDFVIARPAGRTVPLLRQLQVDGERKYLRALNPLYPDPVMDLGDGRILGRVVHQFKAY